jgi:acyl carrier protein
MTEHTNSTRLLSIITREIGAISTAAHDPLDATLAELHADSMDRINIAMEVEDDFKIVIHDDEMAEWDDRTTLRDILGLIEGKLL